MGKKVKRNGCINTDKIQFGRSCLKKVFVIDPLDKNEILDKLFVIN